MAISLEIGLALWTRAEQNEIGIAIKTPHKETLAQQLYNIRREHAPGRFEEVHIKNPPGDEIFLCKEGLELEP